MNLRSLVQCMLYFAFVAVLLLLLEFYYLISPIFAPEVPFA